MSSTQLSEHFTLEEMTYSQTAARMGINNSPPPDVVDQLKKTCAMLEKVRAALGGKPITVTSGYRSEAVNRAVGGVGKSQHQTGQAVDFIVPEVGTPHEVCQAIMALDPPIPYDQLIWEFDSWVHMSQADDNRMMALTINSGGTQSGIA